MADLQNFVISRKTTNLLFLRDDFILVEIRNIRTKYEHNVDEYVLQKINESSPKGNFNFSQTSIISSLYCRKKNQPAINTTIIYQCMISVLKMNNRLCFSSQLFYYIRVIILISLLRSIIIALIL